MQVLIDESFALHVRDIIKLETKNLDAVYEDYIVHMVGTVGLFALKDYGLVEACGMVGGRQLYALVSRN